MADRSPIKVLPDGGGDSTGLAEFVAADTVGIADGGTGAINASAARTNLGITTYAAPHDMSIAAPMKVTVASGVVWTLGWWQSSDGRWWLLGNTASVASFTRAEAEFYIPTGDIQDVPSS